MGTAKKKILLVDDDASVLRVLTAALDRPNRQIERVRSCRMACELAAHERFDLVLCDIFLMDTRRLELVDFLKEQDLDYRIILMSGYLGTGDEDPESDEAFTRNTLLMQAERKGVQKVLQKPFDLVKLQRAVAELLGEEPPLEEKT